MFQFPTDAAPVSLETIPTILIIIDSSDQHQNNSFLQHQCSINQRAHENSKDDIDMIIISPAISMGTIRRMCTLILAITEFNLNMVMLTVVQYH